MDLVSIVIPTLNRQKSLARAIASAQSQTGLENARVEVIVVDNSADASAKETIEAIVAGDARVKLLHAPAPGVANARNAGVAAARGRWVAFLDDDEEAGANWLAQLLSIARRTDADAVFGPIEARADGQASMGPLAPYFSRRLACADGADITELAAYLGTNNSMFDRRRCLSAAEPFDPALNDVGGEDSLLLKRLAASGRRFAFAASACVVEWVPDRRLNWAYVCKRKFLSGQIRVFVNHMAAPMRWDRIALWMAIGLTQFLGAGLAALALWPWRRDDAGRALAIAHGGAGKVLWTRRFRPTLYGAGLVS